MAPADVIIASLLAACRQAEVKRRSAQARAAQHSTQSTLQFPHELEIVESK